MTVPRSVVVVGASLAGLSAVRALRTEGYGGAITVVGDELHMPYDRPPLSKDFLHGADDHQVVLLDDAAGEAAQLDAQWLLGRRAVGITAADDGRRELTLDDASTVAADVAVIATGARARTLIGAKELSGVHTLRTFDDAQALRLSLSSARTVVVIGAGFIGAEVASTATARGLDVTIVEATTAPLAGVLGPTIAELCVAQHEAHGVRLLTGAAVERLVGDHKVTAVVLGDGTELPADVVVIGIGAIPNVEWAAESGLAIDNGFVTDSLCATAVPGIYAIGDCARTFDTVLGAYHRSEHWTNATVQAQIAARRIMEAPQIPTPAPYFWSNQYGKMLQFAGHRQYTDEVRFVDGDANSDSFTVVYERGDRVVATFAMDNPRLFTRYRKQINKTPAPAWSP